MGHLRGGGGVVPVGTEGGDGARVASGIRHAVPGVCILREG